MRQLLPALSLALATFSAPVSAATLGLNTAPEPVLLGSGVSDNDPGGFGFFLEGLVTGGTEPDALGLGVISVGDLIEGAPAGIFLVEDAALQEFLFGEMTDLAVDVVPGGPDQVEILLTNLQGLAAARFGEAALLTLNGEFGPDPLGLGWGSVFGGVDTDFMVEAVTASQIPLPASLPLMLGACTLMLRLRRRSI